MNKIFAGLLYWSLCLSAFAGSTSEDWGNRFFPFHGKRLPEAVTFRESRNQVALYSDRGAWDTGVEHLKQFLNEYRVSYKTFYSEDILDGKLDSSFSTLVMPGGESWTYLDQLGKEGAVEIKKFVNEGGGYIGICAGAFYATSMREGGVATGAYGIGLLEGTAYDGTALHTSPFKEGMLNFFLEPVSLLSGLLKQYRIVLLGGPSFKYSESELQSKKVQVISRFEKIQDPAMVLLRYGKGRVFLSGPHLEVEEDQLDWGDDFEDPESDWPLFETMMRSVARTH